MLTIFTLETTDVPKPGIFALDPAMLDREADALLQWGYRRRAELLAHQAQELREGCL